MQGRRHGQIRLECEGDLTDPKPNKGGKPTKKYFSVPEDFPTVLTVSLCLSCLKQEYDRLAAAADAARERVLKKVRAA